MCNDTHHLRQAVFCSATSRPAGHTISHALHCLAFSRKLFTISNVVDKFLVRKWLRLAIDPPAAISDQYAVKQQLNLLR